MSQVLFISPSVCKEKGSKSHPTSNTKQREQTGNGAGQGCKYPKPTPRDILLPIRLHCLTIQLHQLGTKCQIFDAVGDISHSKVPYLAISL